MFLCIQSTLMRFLYFLLFEENPEQTDSSAPLCLLNLSRLPELRSLVPAQLKVSRMKYALPQSSIDLLKRENFLRKNWSWSRDFFHLIGQISHFLDRNWPPFPWNLQKIHPFCWVNPSLREHSITSFIRSTFTEVVEFLPFPLLTSTLKSSTKVFRFLNGSLQIFPTSSSEKHNFDNILSTWFGNFYHIQKIFHQVQSY